MINGKNSSAIFLENLYFLNGPSILFMSMEKMMIVLRKFIRERPFRLIIF